LRRIDSCITQREVQEPSRTCNESKGEEKARRRVLSFGGGYKRWHLHRDHDTGGLCGVEQGFVEGGNRDEWRGVGYGVGGRGLVECGGHAGQREAACRDRRGRWLRSHVCQKYARERPDQKPRRIGRHSPDVRDLHPPRLAVRCAENRSRTGTKSRGRWRSSPFASTCRQRGSPENDDSGGPPAL